MVKRVGGKILEKVQSCTKAVIIVMEKAVSAYSDALSIPYFNLNGRGHCANG